MTSINKSMNVSELNIQPPLVGKARLSDDIQQTLALLTAFGSYKRKALRCSESGILNTASPRIKDIKHYTRAGATEEQTGHDIPCTEVMVMGHPSNGDLVWVRPHKTATVDNAWPLAKGEAVKFSIDNLNQLNMFIATDTERVIVAYTR